MTVTNNSNDIVGMALYIQVALECVEPISENKSIDACSFVCIRVGTVSAVWYARKWWHFYD